MTTNYSWTTKEKLQIVYIDMKHYERMLNEVQNQF